MNSWTEAAPWLVAVVGWFATHLFSEARERRKEVRSQVDKLLQQVADIEETARSFHTASTFDEKTSTELITELSRIERALDRISKFKIDNFTAVLVHLRRAITLHNFDKSDFASRTYSDQLLLDIGDAIRDFEDELEAQYSLSYPSKFPYFKWSS
jgi:hypothetical protein